MPRFYLLNIAFLLLTFFLAMPAVAQADEAHNSAIVYVESDEELEKVLQSATTPVLIDFYAPWCGPCKQISPIVEKAAEKYEGKVLVVKVNTDNASKLMLEKGIRFIPRFLQVIKNGDTLKMGEQKIAYSEKEIFDLVQDTGLLAPPNTLSTAEYIKLLPELRTQCDIQDTLQNIAELEKLSAIADSEKAQQLAKAKHESNIEYVNVSIRSALTNWYKDLIERKGVEYTPHFSENKDAATSQIKMSLEPLAAGLAQFPTCAAFDYLGLGTLDLEASEVSHLNPKPGESGKGHVHLNLTYSPYRNKSFQQPVDLVKTDEQMTLLPVGESNATNSRYSKLKPGSATYAMDRIDAFLSSVLDIENCVHTHKQKAIQESLQKKLDKLEHKTLGSNQYNLDCKKIRSDLDEAQKSSTLVTNPTIDTNQSNGKVVH